jgi:hypothetical protein
MNPAAPVPGTYYIQNPNGATVYRPGNDVSINIPTDTIITIAEGAIHPQPNLVIGTYINLAGDSIAIILSHAIMEEQRIFPVDPILNADADAMSHYSSSSNNNTNTNTNSSNSNVNMQGGKLRKRKQHKTRKQRKTRKQKSNRKSRRARHRN